MILMHTITHLHQFRYIINYIQNRIIYNLNIYNGITVYHGKALGKHSE